MSPVSLHTPARRALALAVGFFLLGLAAAGSVRWYLARQARTSLDRAVLERAVRLEPDNAAYHHRLGQWEAFSLAEGSLESAVVHYREATRLNPYESDYWIDLANALESLGRRAEAEEGAARALAVDPRTPLTLWRVGNFWLRTDRPSEAFAYLRQAVLADASLVLPVIQTSHRALRDPGLIVRQVLPAEPDFLLAYLRYLVNNGETVAARQVWEALMRLGKEFAPQRALVYVDHLIARGELPEAKQVWDDLVRLRVIPPPAGGEELLYNPDLRAPILNGGFDWRVPRHPQVSVTLGPGRAAPALVIRFTGEDNVHFQHFFQYVLVSPNTRYRFAAWMSTEGISSDSGPRLEVIQVDDRQQPPAYSPQLVGTNDWRPLEVEFTTSPRTRLLRVAVVRPPGRRGRSPIRGTVQAAEFSLRPVETPAR